MDCLPVSLLMVDLGFVGFGVFLLLAEKCGSALKLHCVALPSDESGTD